MMGEFINTIDLLGDKKVLDSLIDSTITEFKDDILTNVRVSTFYECENLKIVLLPNVTHVGDKAFYKCSSLEKADLSNLQHLGLNAFTWDSKLKTVIIRSDSVPTNDANMFSQTPIASGTGYIYVPRALVDSYKAATNWSNYANQYRALEDYTVDGTITGELDATKI